MKNYLSALVLVFMNAGGLVFGEPAFAVVDIVLEEIVSGLSSPVYITHASDGTERLFIVEQRGTIQILDNGTLLGTPFLDIHSRVSSGGERGLLSLAFHPDYVSNGRFFVDYTNTNGDTVISEFLVSAGDPNVADDTSETLLLQVAQPFENHNGGQLQFGPDGMLYIGMGDGGSGGDPFGHGQDITTLLGALLRIDVDSGSPFSIPSDNPFVGLPGRDEIWAYGLRNPWRFSFDRQTGRLFLADVGQGDVEEVDLIEKGGNYGWNIMEGDQCFSPPSDCDMTGLELPIATYGHPPADPTGGRSITGGYVYRGSQFIDLDGLYFFGDYSTGRIWILEETSPEVFTRTELLDTDLSISSFGEDEDGEIYVVDHGGTIYQIVSLAEGEGEDGGEGEEEGGIEGEAEVPGGEGESESTEGREGESEIIAGDGEEEMEVEAPDEGEMETGEEGKGEVIGGEGEGEGEGDTTPVGCPSMTVARDTSLMDAMQPLRIVRDTLLQDSSAGKRATQIYYSR